MSKKRKARKRERRIQSNVLNRHHICFIGRNWSRGYAAALRNFHYCIIPIPRDTLHSLIHANINTVPVPRGKSAKDVLDHLMMLERYGAISDEDDIEKRLNLLASLFDCMEQPTADGFRKQLRIVRKFKNKPP